MSYLLSNPMDFPLHGSRLIEASAGTGKTYTIAALFVRLVIGHGVQQPQGTTRFGSALMPKNILVMTFTKAATEELSDRIRERLAEAANYFRNPESIEGDPFLVSLREDCIRQGHNIKHLARLLDLASQSMDEAAVKTIHGWCQSMLREHAFTSGSLFSQTVETDDDALRLQAAEDYFRCFIYGAEEDVGGRLRELFKTPEQLLALSRRVAMEGSEHGSQNLKALLTQSEQGHAKRMLDIKRKFEPIFADLVDKTSNVKGTTVKLRQFQAGLDWCRSEALTTAGFTDANRKNLSAAELTQFADKKLGGMQPRWQPLTEFFELIKASEAEQQQELARVKQHGANWVSRRFSELQQQRAEMGHDDMLTRLRDALKGASGNALASAIRRQYPVAMVDEFQDTDPVQYEIFNHIYRLAEPYPDTGIFLIGDPKQAIYSFRKADIFTYLRARRDTAGRHYNLAKNFRSSQSMVDSVNALFEHAEQHERGAFLFKTDNNNQLPFNRVDANGLTTTFKHCLLSATVKSAPALLWSVSNEEKRNKDSLFNAAANHHANMIAALLNDPQAGYYRGDVLSARVKPGDIAVLVNNFTEANTIKRALHERGLRSVYLSDRESVFAQRIAKDVFYVVNACAEPRNPDRIHSALASRLVDLSFSELNFIHNDAREWERRVEQFLAYHEQWQRQGFLAMLHRLLHDFQVPAKLLNDRINGERQLADVLHIAELLQQQSLVLDGMPALVNYFAEQLSERHGYQANSRTQAEEQQIRLESDEALIKIVTIHKSKGLQYPLVFMPFVAYTKSDAHRIKVPANYHDEDGNLQTLWVAEGDGKQRLSDEILAEDVRKIYVALTRAQYATFIALEKTKDYQVNPLFYLLNGGHPLNEPLYDCVKHVWQENPHTAVTPLLEDEPKVSVMVSHEGQVQLNARQMPSERRLENWWVASYSALSQRISSEAPLPAPTTADEMNQRDERETAEQTSERPVLDVYDSPASPDSIHHLPKGAGPGTFLHNLLEDAAHSGFDNVATDAKLRAELVERRCLTEYWQPYRESLDAWLAAYLKQPFAINEQAAHVSLQQLTVYQAEPEFWFAVNHVNTVELDTLISQHIHPDQRRPALSEAQLNGMLKGFIDLVFEYDGRYYVADYKSNWLGKDDTAYSYEAMRAKILASRYDLQYVIYTLALHRLLQARLGSDYDYDAHVGGAVYLFLRGHRAVTAGAFTDRPPRQLIEALDRLVSGAQEVIDGCK